MKLIVGLGNPGKSYAYHRHTIGFVVVDRLVAAWGGSRSIHKERGVALAECFVQGQKIIVAKPLLYMNRSGGPVQQIVAFYKILAKDVLVIHDEIDFPLAKIALKFGGRSGGHNGLKDIIAKLDTQDFWRLRIGVGRPSGESGLSVSDYVLGDFSAIEQDELCDVDGFVDTCVYDFIAL